ncbi:MAG: hypothetical protein M3336_00545, partial [Chloroflexota bacterium]|nr:hypothetical protein [Chloroflexota bacterium]
MLRGLDRGRWDLTLAYHPHPGMHQLARAAAAAGVRLAPIPWPDGKAQRLTGSLPGLVSLLVRERPAVFHAQMAWPLACRYAFIAANAAPGTRV